MCRLLAFISQHDIALNHLITDPHHSLIQQSHRLAEDHMELHADGFGIGWYAPHISPHPSAVRSLRPIWNCPNINSLANGIAAKNFMAHIRAATTGEVSEINCHPFIHDKFMFMHNGNIFGFDHIKQQLIHEMSETRYLSIKGGTDSEHIFQLLLDNLYKQAPPYSLSNYQSAMRTTIETLRQLIGTHTDQQYVWLNAVFTDGHELVASRYSSYPEKEAISLYFTDSPDRLHELNCHADAVIIASEPLTENKHGWHMVPSNHLLSVDRHLTVSLDPI